MRLLLLLLAMTACLPAGTIPLAGTKAWDTNGDGIAFNIPNFDGISVNPDGSVNYNPLTYPPLPFDPANPTAPVAPGTPFNFGAITYDASSITGSGVEMLPVTPGMVTLDFNVYSLALCIEVAVNPPTAGGSTVTLSNITGPGLKFVNGVPTSLNFTATVTWRPTLNGFNSTWQPYTGTLTVINGTFIFQMSDAPADWFIGADNVDFHFDLAATVTALEEEVTFPQLSINPAEGGQLSLSVRFDSPSVERYILQSSDTLTGWQNMGADFSAAAPPAPVLVSPTPPKGFFRISKFPPP